jgi:gliding motility-associated-like protein
MPTAFTPNSDGRNDILAPIIKCPVDHYRLDIYNRWGELMFSSDDQIKGWDGKYKGENVDMGAYVYLLEYRSANTNSRKYHKGNISLIR